MPHDHDARTLLAAADQVLAPTYVRPDRVFVSGEGVWLVDESGERYLDMTAGIAVCALGHGAPAIAEEIERCARGLLHTSNLYHTRPAIELARTLVEESFAEQVFFANSGAEANEGAFKFARLWAGERRDIIHCAGSFHGRTLAALAATDRPDYRAPFEPLPAGFRRMAWNDHAGLEAIDARTAAVIVEPVQGESGIRVANADWLRAVRARCDAHDVLLIVDEVQCGLGRTGELWAHRHFDVVPDIMTLAKPLAGGLPMGAVLLGPRPAAAVRPAMHGTTFGGGPLVASVARRVVDTVRAPEFLAGVRARGDRLRAGLEAIDSPRLLGVRGLGLMLGAVVDDPAAVCAAADAERLLIVPAGESVLRFLPPLTITDAEVDEAVTRFAAALARAGT